MGMLLSFLGGAATGLSEEISKSEKEAKLNAIAGVKSLNERYEKVGEENRTLQKKLDQDKDFILAYHPKATMDQINELLARPAVMDAFKKYKNPGSISLDSLVTVSKANESDNVAVERVTALPEIVDKARTMLSDQYQKRTSPLGGLIDEFGQRAFTSAQQQSAAALGTTMEAMTAQKPLTRPTARGTVDMGVLTEQPANAKEIKDKLDVQEIQAAQRFGENSPERLSVKKQKDFITSLEDKVDKTQDARAERLMLEKLDTKDPARIKQIDADLKGIRESIKNHKKLTTIADPKEKEATYNAMKTDVSDYVNTRMRDVKGTKWRNMVEFKTFTDEATGKTITSKTTKVDMTPEQQQEMFAAERKLTAQALKDNGYVLPDGKPRTPVAERLMRNFNITASDLVGGETPAAEQPLPMANAPVAQPATPTTATPTAAPIPTEKVVSAAKVQEQAKANNVPYEQAAAEARKQGYTIR